MNYKLEKFWNKKIAKRKRKESRMNYKLEKFWNLVFCNRLGTVAIMNYKLEKFCMMDKYNILINIKHKYNTCVFIFWTNSIKI